MGYSTLIQQSGLRATKPRLSMLRLLEDEKRPLSIECIEKKLPGINQSTLYRSLKEMARKGIIYETSLGDGKTYYEFQNRHHHHLVCTGCGVMEAVEGCTMHKYVDDIKTRSKKFERVTGHKLEFFGLCAGCSS